MELKQAITDFESIITKYCINDDNYYVSNYVYNGNKVPRVTSILDVDFDRTGLLIWSNILGLKHHKYYTTALNEAAAIGTKTHNYISKYVTNTLEDANAEKNQCIENFLGWWNIINEHHTVNTLLSEQSLTCPYFGGTLDLLISIDDKVYLIDFKTANSIHPANFLQLAAYRYLLNFNGYPDINGCGIVRLSKKKPEFEEVMVNLNREYDSRYMDLCLETFFSLVSSYYHLIQSNRMFEEFKKRYKP